MNKNSSKGFQKGTLLTLLAGAGATVVMFLFSFDAVKKKTVRDFEREAISYAFARIGVAFLQVFGFYFP
jgi:hypothetical protein